MTPNIKLYYKLVLMFRCYVVVSRKISVLTTSVVIVEILISDVYVYVTSKVFYKKRLVNKETS